MGIFENRLSIGDNLEKWVSKKGFKTFLVDSPETWVKFQGDFSKLDTALIHAGFDLNDDTLGSIGSRDVIAALPNRCRRILTSGHIIEDYLRELLFVGADCYYGELFTSNALKQILRLGRVSEEEIKSRGLTVKDHRGGALSSRNGNCS